MKNFRKRRVRIYDPELDRLDFKKLFRMVKLTVFIFSLSIMQVMAMDSYAQMTKVSLNVENEQLEDVLGIIESESEFFFLYNKDLIDVEQEVSVNAKNVTIKAVLDELLEGKEIAHTVYDRQIVLSNIEVINAMIAQQKTVTGIVTDEAGHPLPGASVLIKGTTQGTVTNMDGNYTISNVPENTTLEFSFIGMLTQEITVGTQAEINVAMEADAIGIEEVVAIGYGSLRRKDLTSSVTTVSAEQLNKGVSINPIMQLQGKVPGLSITKDGDPNGGASIILRGASTLRGEGAQTPFYVIDGIPGGIMPPIDDVVSIDVLKDASATAIYGSRAANGVILVTTKKGKIGQAQVSYNAYAAFETIANGYDMLSPDEYRSWIGDMGLALDPVDDDGVNTIWKDELTRVGISHNHNLSISGGNNNTTYIASVNYLNNEGIVKTSSNESFVMRANVEQKLLKDKLKVGLSMHNAIGESQIILGDDGSTGLFNTMWKYLPTVNVRNEDGSYRENYGAATYNPVALIEQNIGKSKSRTFLGAAKAELNIVEGLDYTLNVSYKNSMGNDNSYMQKGSRLALAYNGLATRTYGESAQKLLENFASYKKELGGHNFNILAGYSWEELSSGDGFQTSSSNFVSDETLYYNLAMGSNYEGFVPDYGTYSVTTLRLISGYARMNYDYKNRYLLQATVRRDGSSAFGENNRWGTFPSVSVGWRILEESFMQNQNVFYNLKLRAGYGVSGNSIGFNPLISRMRYGQSGTTLYDGAFIKGIIPTQNANPDLKWETTSMLNIGLDFAVFNGRVSGVVEYYEKTTNDLLWTYDVSPTEYYVSTYTANVGSMENKGFEFSLSTIPVQTNDFSWNSNLVLSHNKNLLTSLSNDQFQMEYLYVGGVGNHGQSGMNSQILQEGYPLGTFYTWEYAGPDENGQSQYYAEDGTLTTSPTTDDRRYAGNAQAKLTGGWQNTITYKNLSLDFLIRGVTGNKVMNVTLSNLNYPGEATHYNQHKMVLESPVIDINAPFTSTRYLEDGAYLRFDNITLMYDLKLRNSIVKGLKIYTTVNNAFVITGYRGCDPEVYMGGITPGIDDDNYYPKTRSFILGVNVDF